MAVSNVLVVGHPCPETTDFGADFVPSLQAAVQYLHQHRPAVLVFGENPNEAFEGFCEQALALSPDSLWIVSGLGLDTAKLLRWTVSGQLHALVDDFQDPDLEAKLQSALEAFGESLQRRLLAEMVEEQSTHLKRLSSDLELRAQKRQKSLRKSQRRHENTKTRTQAFHKALLGIHRASTIIQMEQSLNEALQGTIDIDWVRVRFEAQSLLTQKLTPNVLAVELPFTSPRTRAEALFAKKDGARFSAEERDFLQEISEALALALSRLQKLELAETLKGQWQATFDSIPHALCLATQNFEIVKLNRAFQQMAGAESFSSLLGKNCLGAFFGRDFRPPMQLESPFSFRNSRRGVRETEHFEVSGQRLGLTHDNQTMQLILIRPITDEVRFERRILDASKLAELGTIGSSIAHELNNPLGGMLSFLQLILMDLSPDDVLREEIKAMEQAVLRCRDIVQNLLSFARKQDLGDFTIIDLNDVVQRATKLIELQSKSMGIGLIVSEGVPAPVQVSPNALTQAVCNILQNSVDAISEKQTMEPGWCGEIHIETENAGDDWRLRISDNGMGIKPEVQSQIFNPLFTTRDPEVREGMGLTTAFAIISDHKGQLEILSQTGSGTTVLITLPKAPTG